MDTTKPKSSWPGLNSITDDSNGLSKMEDDYLPHDEQVETASIHACNNCRKSPNPNSMASVLNTVKPVISGALKKYPGVNSGVLSGEAKRLAIAAIKTYDPSHGATLQTHVYAD